MEDQKRHQIDYHEREHYCTRKPRRPDSSNPLVGFLNNYRLRTMREIIGAPLAGKTVLSVCGGDGEEADCLQRQGARVTMIDLSEAGVKAARLRNPALRCLVMDAESLAFADRSFDWAIVREGLHHLARPLKGLYEMERVAREGFAVLEGQDSLVVRLLVKLGFGESWDPAGGYVYRFSRREIHKVFCSMQTLAGWCIDSVWLPYGNDMLRYFPIFRRFVYPVINQRIVREVLTGSAGRFILKALFRVLNLLTGRWGNCLIVVAWKKPL